MKKSRRGVSTTIIVAAIILIVIIIVGSLYALQIGPFAPPVKPGELIMGTTDSVESAVDPAQAYDFFGWEIIQNIGATLVEVDPGSAATADDYIAALATDWTTSEDLKTWNFTLSHHQTRHLPAE